MERFLVWWRNNVRCRMDRKSSCELMGLGQRTAHIRLHYPGPVLAAWVLVRQYRLRTGLPMRILLRARGQSSYHEVRLAAGNDVFNIT